MLYFVFLLIVFAANCNAVSDKEVIADFTKRVLQCSAKQQVSFTELMNLQKMIVPKDMKSKCLLLCAYKSMNAINEKGFYDMDEARKNAERVASGDKDRLQKGLKVAEECQKINQKAVTDGEKGCDRAALLFGCLLEQAPKHGFEVKPKSA